MQTALELGEKPLTFPFGKYKDQLVEVIRQTDPEYIRWLLDQPWFKQKFPTHCTVILNFGAKQENTPAHNRMQMLFLDDAICHKVIAATRPWLFKGVECCELEFMLPKADRNNPGWKSEGKAKAHLLPGSAREWSDSTYEGTKHRVVGSAPATLTGGIVERFPEARGWDWVIRTRFGCSVCNGSASPLHVSADQNRISDRLNLESVTVGLELKPTLGDDYPMVLRQMQKHGDLGSSWVYGYRVLIVGRFDAEGATVDQVTKFFKEAGITMVTLDEILDCDLV